MIQEIINFENEISKETKLKPPVGLNILVSFDENNQPKTQFGIWQKSGAVETDFLISEDRFYDNCTEKFSLVAVNIVRNKRLDNPNCANASFSPFSLIYSTEYLLNIDEKLSNLTWNQYIKDFFIKARAYSENDEFINQKTDLFENYCLNIFRKNLSDFNEIIDNYNRNLNKSQKKISFDKDKVYLFLEDIGTEYYSKVKIRIIKSLASSSNDSNSEFKSSDSLHTYREIDKPFSLHHTATFKECYKINDSEITIVGDFFSKLKKGTFPRPLPIFIDKDELNNKILNLYEKSGREISYSKILENLFEENPSREDIQNYYLLFTQWEGKLTKKFKIKDLDFVSSFRYDFKCKVEDIFDNQHDINITNIFEFERKIVKELFDNCLVMEKEDKGKKLYYSNYFNEDFKAKTANTYRLVTKYKKAFFDFIYKSQTHVITGIMFRDIILSGVLDTLKDYEYRTKDSQKEERIKKLLNIYFNLNSNFDTNNSNFNQFNMASFTKTHLEKIRQLVSEEEKHIESDEEAAFYTGQLIHYLLSQSGASGKSHSLLLPYLQKNDYESLKEKVIEDIKRYSHAISFNNLKFNKLSAEVLGYKLEGSINKYMSFILAGYFSKNILYSKS